MKKAVLLIITTLAAASCIEIDFAEKTPVFSVSSSRVLLPADRDEGPGRVGDTLWITSNRTWTAAVEDTPDWISLGTDGHLGLSGVSEAVPLVIHCKDNQTNAARTARIRPGQQ